MPRDKLLFCIVFCLVSAVFSQPEDTQTDSIIAQQGEQEEQAQEDTLEQESIQEEPIPREAAPMDSIPTSGSDAKEEFYDTLSSPLDTMVDTLDTADIDEEQPEVQYPLLDTTIKIWDNPFWAAGMGWSLGAMPVFDLWQEGLPDSSRSFVYQSDTVTRRVNVQQDFPTYNTSFPLSLVYHIPSDTQQSVAVELTAWTMGKRYEAQWRDTSVVYSEIDYRLRLWYVGIGANYYRELPERYFSIDAVDRTMINVGAAFAPFLILNHQQREKTINTPQVSDQDTYIGRGISWRIGLSTMREITPGRGAEINVVYQGHWMGGFRDGDIPLKRRRINPADDDGNDNVSFTAHRFILFFRFILGKRFSIELGQ